MDPDRINRMRTLWKKGRNMYASFFTELGEVRKEIGDEALAHWCAAELYIGLSVINDSAKLLLKGDAQRVRDDLARAKAAEKASAKPRDNKTHNENVILRARVAELEAQLAAHDNEMKRNGEAQPKNKGGRPCLGDRPMTGYQRLKAWRQRQREAR